MGQLSGQVAIVTGGNGTVGGAISRALAEAGAHVVVNGRNAEKTGAVTESITAAGHSAETYLGDVTDEGVVRALCADVIGQHGRVDIVVNTVGGGRPLRIVDMTLDTWQAMLDLNARSLFLCAREILPHMTERGYGRILGIGSGGWHGAIGLSSLSSSKAAAIGFVKTLAMEAGPAGITANVLVLGHVNSPGWAKRSQNLLDTLMTQVPTGHLIDPEEIGAAAAFLCSPLARSITGEVIQMTGGMDWTGPQLDFSELLKPGR